MRCFRLQIRTHKAVYAGGRYTKEYSKLCQIYKMEFFTKIVNGFKPLTIVERNSILDVWQGFRYTYGTYHKRTHNHAKHPR